jgi:hypothetical protein
LVLPFSGIIPERRFPLAAIADCVYSSLADLV